MIPTCACGHHQPLPFCLNTHIQRQVQLFKEHAGHRYTSHNSLNVQAGAWHPSAQPLTAQALDSTTSSCSTQKCWQRCTALPIQLLSAAGQYPETPERIPAALMLLATRLGQNGATSCAATCCATCSTRNFTPKHTCSTHAASKEGWVRPPRDLEEAVVEDAGEQAASEVVPKLCSSTHQL